MKKQKPTKTALSKALGCSRSTLHTWEAAGCPVSDIKAARQWVTANGVGSDMAAPPDLRRKIAEKRLAILNEQLIAAQRDNAKAAGEMVSFTEARQQAGSAAFAFFDDLDLMSMEMPPVLAGLDHIAIHRKLCERREKIRNDLNEKFDAIGTPAK